MKRYPQMRHAELNAESAGAAPAEQDLLLRLRCEQSSTTQPLILLFVARECPGSSQLTEMLTQMAQGVGTNLSFISVDVAREPAVAGLFQVHSTPTLLVLLRGVVLYRALGVLPERELREMIEAVQRSHAASASLSASSRRAK